MKKRLSALLLALLLLLALCACGLDTPSPPATARIKNACRSAGIVPHQSLPLVTKVAKRRRGVE